MQLGLRGDSPYVSGLVPYSGEYLPLPFLTTAGSASLGSARPLGAHSHRHEAAQDDHYVYVGFDTTIKEIKVSNWSVIDVGRAVAYVLDTFTSEWNFVSWGNEVWATSIGEPVQRQTTRGADFADGITSTAKPAAKYIATVKNQLWLGHTSGGGPTYSGQDVWWSAVDNALDFDISDTTQCDRQDLIDDYGIVTGLVGGDYAIIFKEQAIYRADFVGAPLIYNFTILAVGEGTLHSKSIVAVGQDVYFLDSSGFKVIKDGKYVETIGANAVARAFLDEAINDITPESGTGVRYKPYTSPTYTIGEGFSIVGAHDRSSKCIWWAYHSDETDSHRVLDRVLFYNYADDRWGFFQGGFTAGTARGISYIVKAHNNMPVANTKFRAGRDIVLITRESAASAAWAVGIPSLTACSAQKWFTGAGELEPGKICKVLGARPIYRLSSASDTVTTAIKGWTFSSPFAAASSAVTFDTTAGRNGMYPCPSGLTGNLHQFSVALTPSAWGPKEIIGLEVEYELSGTKG